MCRVRPGLGLRARGRELESPLSHFLALRLWELAPLLCASFSGNRGTFSTSSLPRVIDGLLSEYRPGISSAQCYPCHPQPRLQAPFAVSAGQQRARQQPRGPPPRGSAPCPPPTHPSASVLASASGGSGRATGRLRLWWSLDHGKATPSPACGRVQSLVPTGHRVLGCKGRPCSSRLAGAGTLAHWLSPWLETPGELSEHTVPGTVSSADGVGKAGYHVQKNETGPLCHTTHKT